ncbi:hypothetical protein [Acinetobacter indicus]|uniref:hypothetical protein n=1 Tax=Acinetobacter indicus TaxID=756892 RepID=UPI00209AE0CE|nr:hypothetical protein [Acinetobacter indicus]MCO8100882.1 hypothetical protein [Acinetobacter indicus]MCO8106469.1 hypothetical protein [Acinetobacter indicus]MCO8112143.1 hypothetical protein [Acinetobacter indicus]
MDIQKDEDFEKAWQENRHIWESTKNLAKAMFYAGQAKAQAVPEGFVVASTKDLNIIYDQINDWNTDWPLVFELFNRILEAQEPANESE